MDKEIEREKKKTAETQNKMSRERSEGDREGIQNWKKKKIRRNRDPEEENEQEKRKGNKDGTKKKCKKKNTHKGK